MRLNVLLCPGWDPGTEEGHWRKTKGIWIKCGLSLIICISIGSSIMTNVPH